jgi:hypothetical protein
MAYVWKPVRQPAHGIVRRRIGEAPREPAPVTIPRPSRTEIEFAILLGRPVARLATAAGSANVVAR